jgi:type II secretory pathway pseudopilin PulG
MKKFFRKININFRVRAFTIVETLVATMIVSMIILGPLTVAMSASSYAKQTKDVMIATYLAQESAELLHHLQDSIYLKCVGDNNSSNTVCQPIADGNGIYEIPRQTAWRVFKNYLSSGVSCFAVSGCTYDFINMTANEDLPPIKYFPSDTLCNSLSVTPSFSYVCSGAHGIGGTVTSFSRTVLVESIPTFSEIGQAYNDDLRVTTTVTFLRKNGIYRSVKLVDFLHARS